MRRSGRTRPLETILMAAEIHDHTTIRLHDGEQVTLTRWQAERIYDELLAS